VAEVLLPNELGFEQWYVKNVFDLERSPIGSAECGSQRKAWHAALEASQHVALRQALDLLRGLHPEITRDEPMEVSQQIFDHVMATHAQARRDLVNAHENIQARDQVLLRQRAALAAQGLTFEAPAPHPAGPAGAHLAQLVGDACACRSCLRARDARDAAGWPILMGTMVVCMQCGNKRCPHAESHESACTGSNQPSGGERFGH